MNLLQKRFKNEEQEKCNSDIDNLNFIISKLENLDQQLDLNQTYINILVTDNGQVLSNMYK